MKIRFGYDLIYGVPSPAPMVLMLHSQPNSTQVLIRPDDMRVFPEVPLSFYFDSFGNSCTRLEAPAGTIRITADGIMEDSGMPEADLDMALLRGAGFSTVQFRRTDSLVDAILAIKN